MIVDHEGLARTLEAYLKHDFDTARVEEGGESQVLAAESDVEQVTITPLLTPDPGVYQAAMLKLIQSTQTKLYIQP